MFEGKNAASVRRLGAIRSVRERTFRGRCSLVRRVTKTATINLLGNRYGVDPALIGRTAEVRFDPEDLTVIEVFDHGVGAGIAAPFLIGRHVHPAVPQAAPPTPAVAPEGGIDYLGLIAAAQAESLGEASISYRDLRLPGFEDFDEPPDPTGDPDADIDTSAAC